MEQTTAESFGAPAIDGQQINAETLPDSFLNLGTDSLLGIPILVIIALIVIVIVGQWLRDFRAGRELYAIGSNPEGARLAGVRSERRVAGTIRDALRVARRPCSAELATITLRSDRLWYVRIGIMSCVVHATGHSKPGARLGVGTS